MARIDKSTGLRIVRPGDTVTYHGTDGDRDAILVRLAPGGRVTLRFPDEPELEPEEEKKLPLIIEGTEVGQWSR